MFGEATSCPEIPTAFSTGFFDRAVDSDNKCQRYLLARVAAEDCRSGKQTTPEEFAHKLDACRALEQREKTTLRLAATGVVAVGALAWWLLR